MPFTFDDLEKIEIEKAKNKRKIEKRNAIIVYVTSGIIICLLALTIAEMIGVL